MPMLGFGTWQLQGQLVYEATRHALQVGYRHIDTATMYRNEDQIGRAIADSGLERAARPRHHQASAGQRGPRLRHHRREPEGAAHRLRGPLAGALAAPRPEPGAAVAGLPAVRDEGLTRTIGVSNYSVGEIDDLIEATGRGRPSTRSRWSPARYDEALLAAHAKRGVAVEGYSPLKGTRLRDRTLAEIAAKYGVTPAQVDPALAPRNRRHRHPQVLPPRTHRAELRPLQLLPNPRRSSPHQPPLIRPSSPPHPWPARRAPPPRLNRAVPSQPQPAALRPQPQPRGSAQPQPRRSGIVAHLVAGGK